MKFYHYLIVIAISFLISLTVSVFVREGYFSSPEFIRKNVKVPDLSGQKSDMSALMLADRKLNLNVAGEEYTDEAQKGSVFRQSPAAGEYEKSGKSVDVWISKGPMEITVPETKGMSRAEAAAALEKSFLTPGTDEEEASGEIESGKVIYSKPPAGTPALRNSQVVLVVSSGKKMTTVPRVTNRSLSSAKRLLKSRSLKLGMVKKETNIDKRFDIIMRQYPPAGRKVAEGTSVTVVINAESN